MAEKLTMEQLKDLITEAFESKIKELGLDKIDIKHGIVPQETKQDEDEFAKLPKEERLKQFIKSVVNKDFVVVKALGGGSDPEGGFLIPEEFNKEIIDYVANEAVVRPIVTVEPVGERTGTRPKVASIPSYAWGGENNSFNESQPSFGEIAYAVKRLDVFTAMSRELLADSAVDLPALIKKLFGEAYTEAEDNELTNGQTASGAPFDGLTKDANITAQALSNALDYKTLVDIIFSIPKKYRKNLIVMTSTRGVGYLRKLTDGQGRPIFLTPEVGGYPTVLGFKVVENPYMEDTLVDPDGTPSSGDEYYTADMIIADFKNAILFDRGEFGIEATTEGGDAFLKHQVLMKAWNRIDFKIARYEAFLKVTGVYV